MQIVNDIHTFASIPIVVFGPAIEAEMSPVVQHALLVIAGMGMLYAVDTLYERSRAERAIASQYIAYGALDLQVYLNEYLHCFVTCVAQRSPILGSVMEVMCVKPIWAISSYVLRTLVFHSMGPASEEAELSPEQQEEIDAAAEQMESPNVEDRIAALGRFLTLFGEGLAYPEASAAAAKGSRSRNRTERMAALVLLALLVGIPYAPAYPDALAAAVQEMGNQHGSGNDGHAFWFLKELVKRSDDRACMQVAMTWVMQHINSPDVRERIQALKLLTALVDRGFRPSYPEASNAAVRAVARHDREEHEKGLELLRILVLQEHEPDYPTARDVAVHSMASQDREEQESGFGLLDALMEVGYEPACRDMLDRARRWMRVHNEDGRRLAREIVEVLVEQRYAPALVYQRELDEERAAVLDRVVEI